MTINVKARFAHRLLLSALLAALATPLHAELPSVQRLVDFTANLPEGGNGALPSGPLVEGADGWLYSATGTGGDSGRVNNTSGGSGAIFFRFKPTQGYQALVRPGAMNNWLTTLLASSDGSLYSNGNGMSSGAGLYRYSPDTHNAEWQLVRGISGSEGVFASFGWIEGEDARLHSYSYERSLFAVTRDGESLTVTHQALGDYRPMIKVAHKGKLYGATARTRGVIFSIDTDGSNYREMQAFPSTSNTVEGWPTFTSVSLIAHGDWIYGYSIRGGTNNNGMLFRLRAEPGSTGNYDYEALYQFTPAANNVEGIRPTALVSAQDGHLYGVTSQGGINNAGVVFRWNTANDRYETLFAFDPLTGPPQNFYASLNPPYGPVGQNLGSNLTGLQPTAFMQARDGTFYGTTLKGGGYGWGVLFKFMPGDEVPIFNFQPKLDLAIGQVTAGALGSSLTVATGHDFKLAWRGQLVRDCVASSTDPDNGGGSAWTGDRLVASAGETYTANTVGTWTYTLICQSGDAVNYPDPVVAKVTLTVVPKDADKANLHSGSGGGAFSMGLLALLPLLGASAMRRRRRMAA